MQEPAPPRQEKPVVPEREFVATAKASIARVADQLS
jgi:hypothetical protein